MRRGIKATTKGIGVDFKRDAVIPATCDEPADVKGCEAGNAKLAILLGMDKFVEEQAVRKGLVGNDDIIEGDSDH